MFEKEITCIVEKGGSIMSGDNFVGKDIGNPSKAGSLAKSSNGFLITAGGADIWGNTDQFYFVYDEQAGDFDFIARLESLSKGDLYSKAGIMARETLNADSRHVYIMAFPDNDLRNNNNGGFEFQFRSAVGGESFAIYPPDYTVNPPLFPVNFPDTWMRLNRVGDRFDSFFSLNGSDWKLYSSYTIKLASKVYLGIAVTSHNEVDVVTARVRDIFIA
jgi:hypothetical protein